MNRFVFEEYPSQNAHVFLVYNPTKRTCYMTARVCV